MITTDDQKLAEPYAHFSEIMGIEHDHRQRELKAHGSMKWSIWGTTTVLPISSAHWE